MNVVDTRMLLSDRGYGIHSICRLTAFNFRLTRFDTCEYLAVFTAPVHPLELPRIREIRIRICLLPGSKIKDPDPLRRYILLNLVQNFEHLKFVLSFLTNFQFKSFV